MSRKRLAEARPRVRGQFVKAEVAAAYFAEQVRALNPVLSTATCVCSLVVTCGGSTPVCSCHAIAMVPIMLQSRRSGLVHPPCQCLLFVAI